MNIKPLTSENWHDFEKLFSACEQCRECWCLNHRVRPSEVVTGEQAKAKMKSLLAAGQVGGLLGYVTDQCVAWLSVDALSTQCGHDYVTEGNSFTPNTWTIHCVYIAPKCRGLGYSQELIRAGIEFAKSQGAKEVLVFPIPEETRAKFPEGEAEFSGRHSTFKKIGFIDKERLNDFYQVMQLEL